MNGEVAIIGGSGIGERLAAAGGERLLVPTPFGPMRGTRATIEDVPLFLVKRHGGGHKMPPHRVAYKALAIGLQRLGIQTCFSTAAVGSLRPEWPVGQLVICSDFLDLSGRNVTLYDRDVVHTPIDPPFPASDRLADAAKDITGDALPEGTYLTANGPRYETPAEIRMMRTLGADVVGMTVSSEAVAMREAGIDYGCLAIVSNLAVGLSPEGIDHGAVTDAVARVADTVQAILVRAAQLSGDPGG